MAVCIAFAHNKNLVVSEKCMNLGTRDEWTRTEPELKEVNKRVGTKDVMD